MKIHKWLENSGNTTVTLVAVHQMTIVAISVEKKITLGIVFVVFARALIRHNAKTLLNWCEKMRVSIIAGFILFISACGGGGSSAPETLRGSSEDSRDGTVSRSIGLEIIDSRFYSDDFPVNYDPDLVRTAADDLVESYMATMDMVHLSMSYLYTDVQQGRFTSIWDDIRDEHRGMAWTLNNLCELGLTATGFIEQYRGNGCRVYSFLPTYSSRYVLVLASQYDELKKQTTFATGFEAVGSKKRTGSSLTLSLDEGILSLDRKLIWYTQNGYQQDESACTLHEVMNEDDISVCAELVAESRFILDEVKRHVERGLDTYLRND